VTVQQAWVIFASGAIWHPANAITALATRSHLVHVAYGDHETIVERTVEKGERLVPFKAAIRQPMIQTVLSIDVERSFNPEHVSLDKRPISVARGLAYLWSGGRVRHSNCVSRCREYLALCGYVTPDNLLSPILLYEYLRARGATEVVIDESHPAQYAASRRLV
jgi:hypothetical protein